SRLGVRRRLEQSGLRLLDLILNRLAVEVMPVLLIRFTRQRCARTTPKHRIQNHMTVKRRRKFGGDCAVAEYQHACAEVEKFFNFAREENDRFALGSEVPQVSIEIKLRANVDAARWIVEYQDVGLLSERARD